MEVRILNAMRKRKQQIETIIPNDSRWFRVARIRKTIGFCQRTLDPHDFYPSGVDVCRFPDIRKVILYGTYKEFNTCAEELTSRFPKLTSQILEERTAKISALFPLAERPENALSLATAWFNCKTCSPLLIHGADALKHECPYPAANNNGVLACELTFDTILHGGWCAERSKFTFSETASTIARRLILDCGEDPENITLKKMNSKLPRFASHENGEIVVRNWREAVSYTGSIGVHCHGLTAHHAPPSSNTNFEASPRAIDTLDRTNAQSSCMIPTYIMRDSGGSVSIVGGITSRWGWFCALGISRRPSDTSELGEFIN